MDEQYGQLIEPSKVPFTLGAPGWYILAGLILIALVTLAGRITKIYKKNLYRRTALHWLEENQMKYGSATNQQVFLYEINMLLKQIAMTKYGRIETASLRGHDWISFLNKSTNKKLFDNSDSAYLEMALYENKTMNDNYQAMQIFLSKAKDWIKTHRKIKN